MDITAKNPAAVEWGRLIKRRRDSLGLNQTELAAKVGTVQQVVSAWERFEYPPNAMYQARLVQRLGIDPIELHDLMRRLSADGEGVA